MASPVVYPASKINFVVSARDLPHRIRGSTGLSSIPDPYVRMWYKDNTMKAWAEICRTDHIVNTSNPDWFHVHTFNWKRETGQVWRVEIVDFDPFNTDDLIGIAEIDVDDYVLKHNKQISGRLSNGGTLIIKGAAVLQFRLQIENLPKLDSNSGSDPYVQCFWSFGPNGEKHLFHRTRTIENVMNVAFREPVVFQNYQQGANQYFTFKVFDEDTMSDDHIGEVSISMDSYVAKGETAIYRLNEGKNNATLTISPDN